MKVRKILRLLGVVEKLPRNYNEDIQPVDFGTYYCETKDEYLPFCLQTIDPKLYAIAQCPCPPTWY